MTERPRQRLRNAWILGTVVLGSVAAVVVAARLWREGAEPVVNAQGAALEQRASQPVDPSRELVRFAALDVVIDAGDERLAAWQVEVRLAASPQSSAEVVGVEGGEHAAFRSAPYYDPAALSKSGRIILAAFHTGAVLPKGKTRVARLHVLVDGGGELSWQVGPLIATDRAVSDIAATLSIVESSVGDIESGAKASDE